MQQLLEILSPDFILRNSLYASLLLGLALPLVGIHLVVSNRTILALALPEVSNLGVALVALLGTCVGIQWHTEEAEKRFIYYGLAGALTLMVFTLWVLYWLQRLKSKSRVADSDQSSAHEGAEEGVLFVSAWAATLAIAASNLIPELGLLGALRGELLAVNTPLLMCMAVGFGLVIILLVIFSRPLQLLLFDARIAYAQGLPTGKLHALSMGMVCVSIALGSLCAGPFAVFAFLIIPSVTLIPFIQHFNTLCWCSSLLGVASAFAGFYASYTLEKLNLPTATAQILILSIVWISSRGYLWMKSR